MQKAILSRTKRQQEAEPEVKGRKATDETDDLLDEIDELLEETLVQRYYVQKGGE